MKSSREQASATIFRQDYLYIFGGIERNSKDPLSSVNLINKYSI